MAAGAALAAALLVAGVPGYATAQETAEPQDPLAALIASKQEAGSASFADLDFARALAEGGDPNLLNMVFVSNEALEAALNTPKYRLDSVLRVARFRGLIDRDGQPTRYSYLLDAKRSGSITEDESVELLVLGRPRFDLWRNCAPLGVQVNLFDDINSGLSYYSNGKFGYSHDDAAGLTNDLVNLVESRLRAARIYDGGDNPNPDLSISVDMRERGNSAPGPGAFRATIEFTKGFHDGISGMSYGVTTWEKTRGGRHGNDDGFILGVVSQLLDEFLVGYGFYEGRWTFPGYLTVNESACGGP